MLTSPLIGSGDAIADDRLLGTWSESDEDSDTFTFRRNGDGYLVSWEEDGETEETTASLTQIGDLRFLQLAEDNCSNHLFFDDDGDERCFGIYKFEIDQRMVRIAPLDHERLFRDSVAGKLDVSHEIRREVEMAKSKRSPTVYTCVVLTAPTAELRRFLLNYAGDRSVFGESMTLVRRSDISE